MPTEAPAPPSREKETGRLEAFSDGVFAIAITLLLLGSKVPRVETPGGNSGSIELALIV